MSLQSHYFQMEPTAMDILRKLKTPPERPHSLQEWSSRINLCILLALKSATVEQFGLLRFHIRRVAELFRYPPTLCQYALLIYPSKQNCLLTSQLKHFSFNPIHRIALILHERMTEGATDVTINLDEVEESDDPLTWMYWFRQVQREVMVSTPTNIKGGSTKEFEDILMHLDDIYQGLNRTQSNMEGAMSCVQNYII